MTDKRKRYILILLAIGALALSSIACDDSGDVTPTPAAMNEEITENAAEVLETAAEAQSTLCKICLLGSDDCSGVCK